MTPPAYAGYQLLDGFRRTSSEVHWTTWTRYIRPSVASFLVGCVVIAIGVGIAVYVKDLNDPVNGVPRRWWAIAVTDDSCYAYGISDASCSAVVLRQSHRRLAFYLGVSSFVLLCPYTAKCRLLYRSRSAPTEEYTPQC
jgi:hypothetical protein